MKRITIYKDPMGEEEWILATDTGDPSEEVVLGSYTTRAAARRAARKAANEADVIAVEEKVELM